MIQWLHQEEGYCEGIFKSVFFRDEEDCDELNISMQRPVLSECAEKCVEAFNNLTAPQIREICEEIIKSAQECGDEEFELPELDNALDILKYCWFTGIYVNMVNAEDEVAFVVEGEGDWGDVIGFAVQNNKVLYVGTEFMDYMRAE